MTTDMALFSPAFYKYKIKTQRLNSAGEVMCGDVVTVIIMKRKEN